MNIYIVEPDDAQHDLLRRALNEHALEACKICKAKKTPETSGDIYIYLQDANSDQEQHYFTKPYRFGALADKINTLKNNSQNKEIFSFSHCRIDTHKSMFYREDVTEGIKLTEKELDILVYLASKNEGQQVKRDDLLSAVWGYGQNIETHTLETHIYRLRQKIEEDASQPKFLKTLDEGYVFCGG